MATFPRHVDQCCSCALDGRQSVFETASSLGLELKAERSHHSYIGTEHLLLGLIREDEGLAAIVLRNFGIDHATVRARIESVLGRNERIIIQQIVPTSRVKKVIEISFEEAQRMVTTTSGPSTFCSGC